MVVAEITVVAMTVVRVVVEDVAVVTEEVMVVVCKCSGLFARELTRVVRLLLRA
jgi:hypothetical protein